MKWMLIGALAAIIVGVGLAGQVMSETLQVIVGEKRYARIETSVEGDIQFSVDTATYQIKSETNGIMWPPVVHPTPAGWDAHTTCIINGKVLEAWMDTTGWTTGSEYRVYFYWVPLESPREYIIDVLKVTTGEDYL